MRKSDPMFARTSLQSQVASCIPSANSMVKLPPSVKQLLAQRNPHPFANPPVHALNGVLQRTRSEAKQHGALNGWLVLSVRRKSRSTPNGSGISNAH